MAESKPEAVLREFYNRNGCIRVRMDEPDKGRHGGVELRLVVADAAERKSVLAALKALGLPHGKVYRKQAARHQWVVPVYSRDDILTFLKSVKPHDAVALTRKVQATIKRA